MLTFLKLYAFCPSFFFDIIQGVKTKALKKALRGLKVIVLFLELIRKNSERFHIKIDKSINFFGAI